MNLGHTIASMRKASNFNQREFAEQLGVSNGAVAMWETNKRQPDLDTLKKMAAIFNCSVDFIIGNEKSGGNDFSDFQLFEECFDFRNRIVKELKEQNISEEAFMELTGFDKCKKDDYLYSNRIPSIEDLIIISGVLKISTDYLLDVSQRKRISTEEELLLQAYERCDKQCREYLVSKANVLSVEGLSAIAGVDNRKYIDTGKKSSPSSGTEGTNQKIG